MIPAFDKRQDTYQPLTVGEVTRSMRLLLESNFKHVAIAGEISNYLKHTSGHVYFTLKDDGAQLSCVMFRGTRLRCFSNRKMEWK